jgi:hypothetical protein
MAARRSDDVVYEVIDGQALLVDTNGAELVTLNQVGSMVWENLDGSVDAGALVARLHGRLVGVTREALEADIVAFLHELRSLGLVVDGA